MKKVRALVLVHSTLVPPDSLKGSTEKEIEEWRTEYDVISHLKRAGHEVMPLGLSDSLSELRRAITEWKPGIVFNLLEEFDGIVTYDQHVVAFLELMHQPYTGCNPRGMLLSRDKVLSKQLLSYHRVPTPQFMVFPRGKKVRIPKNLRFPLFVKSSTEDASLGIAQASVVADSKQLTERIAFIHEQTHSDALVEEYIEGRELYVGVMGNDRLKVLPVWEMTFGSLPENLPAIATRKVKWDRGLSTALRHHHGRRRRPARGNGRALGAIVEAHFSGAAFDRLRPHGLSLAGRWRIIRARGECQPEHLSRGGLLLLRTQGRHELRRLAASDHAVGRELSRRLACRGAVT